MMTDADFALQLEAMFSDWSDGDIEYERIVETIRADRATIRAEARREVYRELAEEADGIADGIERTTAYAPLSPHNGERREEARYWRDQAATYRLRASTPSHAQGGEGETP